MEPETSNRFRRDSDDSQKAGRILYIVTVCILCLSAVLIGVFTALSQDSGNLPTPASSDTKTEPETPASSDRTAGASEQEIPPFSIPVSGYIAKEQELAVPVYSMTMDDYRTHSGVDVAAPLGSPVRAVAAGKVTKIWEDAMMGTCLSLSVGGGATVTYKNLGALADGISEGKSVSDAETIAVVGESALLELADEPHIHMEVAVNGVSEDPLSFFSEESREVMATPATEEE